MRLKTAERILSAFVILMIAAILLCSGTGKLLWGYIGIGLAFAGGIFWIIFGRCPHCGSYLGRHGDVGKYCPHCGERIRD